MHQNNRVKIPFLACILYPIFSKNSSEIFPEYITMQSVVLFIKIPSLRENVVAFS